MLPLDARVGRWPVLAWLRSSTQALCRMRNKTNTICSTPPACSYIALAGELTHTCWQMYHRMPSGELGDSCRCSSQLRTLCSSVPPADVPPHALGLAVLRCSGFSGRCHLNLVCFKRYALLWGWQVLPEA